MPNTTAVTVVLKDGRVLRQDTSQMPEDLVRPDDWETMVARFDTLARHLPEEHRQRLAAEVAGLDEQPDAKMLIDLLRWPG